MDVGSVLVNIEGNTAGLNAAVDASVKKLEFLKGVVAGVGAEIQKAAGGDVEIKRLGDSLVKLGNDTKQAERGFQSITSVLGRFFTVAAGINFFRSAAETASHLVDLAKRTEIAVDVLAKIRPVLETSGTSVDAFANSVFRLSVQIGQIVEKTDPVYLAIKQLGVSFNDLAAATPVNQVRMIYEALNKIQDPAKQNAIAFTFFGQSFRSIKPAIEEMIGALGKTDPVLKANIEMVSKYRNTVTDLWDRLVDGTIIGVGSIIELFEKLGRSIGENIESVKPRFHALWDWIDTTAGKAKEAVEWVAKLFAGHGEAGFAGWETSVGHGPQWEATTGQYMPPHTQFPLEPVPVPDRESQLRDKTGAERVKQATTAINSFIDSLKKQNDALIASQAGLEGNADAVKALELEYSLASFKEQLFRDTGAKLTKEQEDKMRALNATIVAGVKANEDYKVASDAMKEAQKASVEEMAKGVIDLQGIFQKLSETGLSDTELALKKINDEAMQMSMTLRNIAQGYVLQGLTVPPEVIEAWKNLGKWQSDMLSKVHAPTTLAEQQFEALRTSLEGLQEAYKNIDVTAKYLGPTFDAVSAKVSNQRQQVDNLIEQLGKQTEGTQAYIDVLEKLKVALEKLDISEGQLRAQQLGEKVGDAITGGIRNTLMGIETGQQSIGEGLKNMLRNIGLELQFLMFDETILKPINAFAKGFVTGLFDSISKQAEENAHDLGVTIGKAIRQALIQAETESGIGKWIGMGLSLIGSLFGMVGSTGGTGGAPGIGGWEGGTGEFAPGPTASDMLSRKMGGMVPAIHANALTMARFARAPVYAEGGGIPIMAHAGEFVMSAPAVQKIGQGRLAAANATGNLGGSNTSVVINGDIVPRQPNMTKDDVIKIMIADADNLGPHFQVSNRRRSG